MAGNTVAVTDASFESEVLKSDIPVLVDFWAEWCGPCKAVAPTLEALADEWQGKVKIAKLDIDSSPNTPGQYGIRSIPTFIIFKDGEVAGTTMGAIPKSKFEQFVQEHI